MRNLAWLEECAGGLCGEVYIYRDGPVIMSLFFSLNDLYLSRFYLCIYTQTDIYTTLFPLPFAQFHSVKYTHSLEGAIYSSSHYGGPMQGH